MAVAVEARNLYKETNDKVVNDCDADSDIPTEQLLLSIVRMGSLTSIPRNLCIDHQDDDLVFPQTSSMLLLERCREQLAHLPKLFTRQLRSVGVHNGPTIKVLQWNHLSQSLGSHHDNFVCCPSAALDWTTRKWRILEEIIQHNPDIICLQEVDHFQFLKKALGSIGYHGMFYAKPDSPCIYLDGNNGPDGCAIFFKTEKFKLDGCSQRGLKVWGVVSNQVALGLILTHKLSNTQLCVASTHLKARTGQLMSRMRNQQGEDIIEWLTDIRGKCPVIVCGDFNAVPCEPVIDTILGCKSLPMVSAYGDHEEQDFTTWKIRETGEEKKVLDYIFHSPDLETTSVLEMPLEQDIGEDRLPSLKFPSDHLSLLAEIKI